MKAIQTGSRKRTHTEIVSISLDHATYELLTLFAQSEERSKSSVVRRALRKYAQDKEGI